MMNNEKQKQEQEQEQEQMNNRHDRYNQMLRDIGMFTGRYDTEQLILRSKYGDLKEISINK